jgi:hypothetical protein
MSLSEHLRYIGMRRIFSTAATWDIALQTVAQVLGAISIADRTT